MDQRSFKYRLRSSSAGPGPSGPAETETLAQVVMLDHHRESMPGREPILDDNSGQVPTYVVTAEAEMRTEIISSDTTVSQWGLSSTPHINTTTHQSQISLSYKRPAVAYPLCDFHKICRICSSFQDALAVNVSLNLLKGLWAF